MLPSCFCIFAGFSPCTAVAPLCNSAEVCGRPIDSFYCLTFEHMYLRKPRSYLRCIASVPLFSASPDSSQESSNVRSGSESARSAFQLNTM
ncbi:hypothetical protein DFH11DRAFT_1609424 [Phellopilus nigrolimitatus]|nr:hypothetical protein DFH11DRAFT_1609424 [Phellopilus nigrolimitatus]